MGRRLFALLRTVIFAAMFVALWTYFIPVWTGGARGFNAAPRPWGWAVLAIGAAIVVPCFWAFAWRGLGTPMPLDPPRQLVVTGPYRWVRNPMYVGMAIVLIGEALVFPQLSRTLFIEVVALWAAVNVFVIAYEEPTLRGTFGADYERYCQHVRRWIPRLRPFDNASSAAIQ